MTCWSILMNLSYWNFQHDVALQTRWHRSCCWGSMSFDHHHHSHRCHLHRRRYLDAPVSCISFVDSGTTLWLAFRWGLALRPAQRVDVGSDIYWPETHARVLSVVLCWNWYGIVSSRPDRNRSGNLWRERIIEYKHCYFELFVYFHYRRSTWKQHW